MSESETTGPGGELSAPYVFEYAYKRSLGPALRAFFTGLRDGRVVGARCRDGRVVVPPTEYDSHGYDVVGYVDVADVGAVTSWAWVAEPLPSHPLQTPFAFALVQLDGAHTALAHALVVDDPASLRIGMRVRARWAEERGSGIRDIVCFEPVPHG